MKTLNRIGVGRAIKHKGVEAPDIEIEVEDCEEYTATFSFYVVARVRRRGENLSFFHFLNLQCRYIYGDTRKYCFFFLVENGMGVAT